MQPVGATAAVEQVMAAAAAQHLGVAQPEQGLGVAGALQQLDAARAAQDGVGGLDLERTDVRVAIGRRARLAALVPGEIVLLGISLYREARVDR